MRTSDAHSDALHHFEAWSIRVISHFDEMTGRFEAWARASSPDGLEQTHVLGPYSDAVNSEARNVALKAAQVYIADGLRLST